MVTRLPARKWRNNVSQQPPNGCYLMERVSALHYQMCSFPVCWVIQFCQLQGTDLGFKMPCGLCLVLTAESGRSDTKSWLALLGYGEPYVCLGMRGEGFPPVTPVTLSCEVYHGWRGRRHLCSNQAHGARCLPSPWVWVSKPGLLDGPQLLGPCTFKSRRTRKHTRHCVLEI